MGDWYSLDTDIKIGKQYAMMVEQNAKLIQDPVITEYVNRIGQKSGSQLRRQVPFTIKVIDSDEINAFTLPEGFSTSTAVLSWLRMKGRSSPA